MPAAGTQVACLLILLAGISALKECARRNYGGKADSIVCVCNSTYCDEVPPLGKLNDYQVAVYTSSKAGKRLERTNAEFAKSTFVEKADVTVKIDASKTFQAIHGFGGAFTDAAGVNLNRLDKPAADQLLRTYFSTDGIEYTLGRVPVASCDFSTFEYSYLDTPDDFDLKTFSLATEDLELKIPYILSAMKLTDNQLKLFASPWSSPGWMKTNGRMKGGGKLKGAFNGKYYKTYAQYFVRFFEEYHKRGVPFWGVTIENEPSAGLNPSYSWQALYLGYEMQRDFANELLGPALRKNPATKAIKIMAHDDQRSDVANAARAIYNTSTDSEQYVDGLAFHWYSFSTHEALNDAHNVNPDKFLLATEACNAYAPWDHAPILGHWERGEAYGHDIIQDLLHWSTGWTDWNLCLNEGGGPNWVGNFVDAPIIVNNTIDEFYKNPMFYYMGHFSKFIRPRSLRVQSSIASSTDASEDLPIEAVAFTTPKNNRVLVMHNTHDSKSYSVAVEDANIAGKTATVTVEPKSIATLVWQKPSAKRRPLDSLLKKVQKAFAADGPPAEAIKKLWMKLKGAVRAEQ